MLGALARLNRLVGVLSYVYPPLRYVPLGALAAALFVVAALAAASRLGVEPRWVSPDGEYRPTPPRRARRASPAPRPEPAVDLRRELVDASGDRRVLGEALRGRPALLYLYSPFCGHCAQRHPRFAEFARALGGRAAVVGIQWRGSAQTVDDYRRRLPAPGELFADPDGSFCASVGVGEFTVLALAADGKILGRSGGENLGALAAALGSANPEP